MDLRDLIKNVLFVNVKAGPDSTDATFVKTALADLLVNNPYWRLNDNTNASNSTSTTVTVLNLIFSVLTGVAMFLCFFSLLASMMANINEQQKEIGVLLAIGLKYALPRACASNVSC